MIIEKKYLDKNYKILDKKIIRLDSKQVYNWTSLVNDMIFLFNHKFNDGLEIIREWCEEQDNDISNIFHFDTNFFALIKKHDDIKYVFPVESLNIDVVQEYNNNINVFGRLDRIHTKANNKLDMTLSKSQLDESLVIDLTSNSLIDHKFDLTILDIPKNKKWVLVGSRIVYVELIIDEFEYQQDILLKLSIVMDSFMVV